MDETEVPNNRIEMICSEASELIALLTPKVQCSSDHPHHGPSARRLLSLKILSYKLPRRIVPSPHLSLPLDGQEPWQRLQARGKKLKVASKN